MCGGAHTTGSSNTTRPTRSGCRAASSSARRPPKLWPTTSMRSMCSAFSVSTRSPTCAPRFHGGSQSETPCPRKSGAYTWNGVSRVTARWRKRPPQLVMPCRQSSGFPSAGPQSCTCSLTDSNYRRMLAVLYDIHANLPALEAVLDDARAKGATAFLLGGDLVGFGPFKEETLSALRELDEPTICIRGNGERWLREPPVDRPDIVENVIEEARTFSNDDIERLYRLPERAEVDGVAYVHGCWWSDVDSFAREPQDADELRVGPLTGRTLVFGHSHVQFRRDGAKGNRLVNPGSAGMPLDGDTRAAWASGDGSVFTFHRTEYDLERTIAAVRGTGEWSDVLVHRYVHASD